MSPAGAFDAAMDALRRHVLLHDLKPGDALPPVGELARTCGVSVATMREALRAWEAMGIVSIRHGVGAFLRPYDYGAFVANLSFIALFAPHYEDNILSLWEILELGCLEQQNDALPEELLQTLDTLVGEMQEGDGLAAEYRFHRQLCQLANNPLAEALFRLLWLAWRNACQRNGTPPLDYALRPRLHRLIVTALREGDWPKAKSAVKGYFSAMTRTKEQNGTE